jgi:hypothetical protein
VTAVEPNRARIVTGSKTLIVGMIQEGRIYFDKIVMELSEARLGD